MAAIQAAVKIIVHSDSQALDSSAINSKTMYNYRRCVNEMAKRYDVCITWLPEHKDIPGNCRPADLARRVLSNEFITLGIPLGICRLIIGNAIVGFVNSGWAASDKGRTAQNI